MRVGETHKPHSRTKGKQPDCGFVAYAPLVGVVISPRINAAVTVNVLLCRIM